MRYFYFIAHDQQFDAESVNLRKDNSPLDRDKNNEISNEVKNKMFKLTGPQFFSLFNAF